MLKHLYEPLALPPPNDNDGNQPPTVSEYSRGWLRLRNVIVACSSLTTAVQAVAAAGVRSRSSLGGRARLRDYRLSLQPQRYNSRCPHRHHRSTSSSSLSSRSLSRSLSRSSRCRHHRSPPPSRAAPPQPPPPPQQPPPPKPTASITLRPGESREPIRKGAHGAICTRPDSDMSLASLIQHQHELGDAREAPDRRPPEQQPRRPLAMPLLVGRGKQKHPTAAHRVTPT